MIVVIAMESTVARPEKVCCLCGRVGGYMIHFEHWSEKEKVSTPEYTATN